MSKLIYITNMSLDGYIEDDTGAFDWGDPDQVHRFALELLRPIGTERPHDGTSNSSRRAVSAPEYSTCTIAYEVVLLKEHA
jgi:hypothetical protein